MRLKNFDGGTRAGGGATLCFGGRIRASPGMRSPRRVAAQASIPRSGSGHPNGLIADPRLRTNVCRGVCSDIRSTPGICSSLCSPGRVAARASKPHSGAGNPNALITDPRLRTGVYRGVCSGIHVRSRIYSAPGICPDLCGFGRATARAAESRRYRGAGGTGLITSARSGSTRLRLTQWYRRNADRNHSKLNRLDLIHIILPPSQAVFCLSAVSFIT